MHQLLNNDQLLKLFSKEGVINSMTSESEGIAVIDRNGKAIFFNSQFPKLLKISESSCKDFNFSSALNNHSTSDLKSEWKVPDNTSISVSDIIVNPSERESIYIIKLNKEVTKNQFEKILNSSVSGIGLFKKICNGKDEIIDFEFVYINEEAENFLNKPSNYLIGKRISNEYPGLIKDGLFDLMVQTIYSQSMNQKEHYYSHEGFSNWLKFISNYFDENHVVLTIFDITRRKNALKQARENQKLLTQTQKAARVGSFSWDIQKNVLSCTEEFCRLFEIDGDSKPTIEDFLSRVDKNQREFVKDCIYSTVYSDNHCDLETKVLTPSGNTFFAWIKAGVEFGEEDKPLNFYGTVVDITNRIESEVALQQANKELNKLSSELRNVNERLEERIAERTKELELSNERFRLLAKATSDIAWDFDLITKTVKINESFEYHFGYKPNTYRNQYELWESLLHPDDKNSVISSLEEAIRNPKKDSWKAEYRLLNINGTYELILDRGYIIRNESQIAIRMVGSMLKITDLRAIEERLRESEQIHTILAESMPQLVYSLNEKGEGDYFNKRWQEYTGLRPTLFTIEMWGDVVHPDDVEHVIQCWQKSVENNTNFSTELRIRSKHGNYRWFLTRALPIRDDKGQIVRWIGTSTDIHDQKLMVENLENAEKQLSEDLSNLNLTNQQLEKVNKELDSFIHIASHDLRSPTKNMEFLLNLLHEEIKSANNDNLSEIFNLVQKSMKGLKTLVMDLTELPKVNDKSIEDTKEVVSLEDILNDIFTSISDLILKNEPVLVTDFQITSVKISPKEIRSILFNLISNAIKYRSEERKPEIHISFKYSQDNKSLVLQVKDNGTGIKKEDIPNVFTPFKRFHKVGHGLGLGMSVVKQTVEKNGGSILVESEYGKGTIFTIILPSTLA